MEGRVVALYAGRCNTDEWSGNHEHDALNQTTRDLYTRISGHPLGIVRYAHEKGQRHAPVRTAHATQSVPMVCRPT